MRERMTEKEGSKKDKAGYSERERDRGQRAVNED